MEHSEEFLVLSSWETRWPSPHPLARMQAGPRSQGAPRVLGRLISQHFFKLMFFVYLFGLYLGEWLRAAAEKVNESLRAHGLPLFS